MTTSVPDVIDHLVGIAPGSLLDQVRAGRQQARDNAQASYRALFETAAAGDFPMEWRFAVAAFVAALHRQEPETAFYRQGLERAGGTPALAAAVAAEAGRGRAEGPAGRFPAGPLSAEDTAPPAYVVPAEARAALGERLAAALEHAHLLVFHPRDAGPAALQALLDAGWSTTGVVTLSQLIAFLAFQLRVTHGLRVLQRRLADAR
ncbi:CMD domain protein [Roseomonas sp. OT10]|uniref:CMD domain protein n=1 Tax=Roseomonas cutis TaxID=2897332 RepID=UPI001E326A3F|nr:CMD domain protein [Roseomonas sp. OT10]UFN49303.1 CMD domain protein [Roseomonas sp. OT10]